MSPSPPPGWTSSASGLERRELRVAFPELGYTERLVLFRWDPAAFALRVFYTPGRPRRVLEWNSTAVLMFNGGYFDEHDAALGLVVSDSRSFGRSYEGFGGMLQVDVEGRGRVRSLAAEPFSPEEGLQQAVQAFPLLVYPDGSYYAREDGQRARRTVIGQDGQGRLVLIISGQPVFTLAGLAAWLRASDLDLRIALNLDGGGSTGYAAGANDWIDSQTAVPAVVVVERR